MGAGTNVEMVFNYEIIDGQVKQFESKPIKTTKKGQEVTIPYKDFTGSSWCGDAAGKPMDINLASAMTFYIPWPFSANNKYEFTVFDIKVDEAK